MTLKDIKGLLYQRFFFGYFVNDPQYDEIKDYLYAELEPILEQESYFFSKLSNLVGPYGQITHNIYLDMIYYYLKKNNLKRNCKQYNKYLNKIDAI